MLRKTFISTLLAFTSLSVVGQPTTLEEVFAPHIVGTPPCDAYIGLSRLESGELRHYNYGEQKTDEAPYYLSSSDNGFTWNRVNLTSDLVYADTQSPTSGEYIRAYFVGKKVYSVRTRGGLEGGRDIRVVDDSLAIMVKPPIFIRDGKRVVVAAHRIGRLGALTYISDDDGLTWQKSNLVTAPLHEPNKYDKSYRWNHGAVEPTVTELADGRLWMIVRTSRDRHYQSFSEDGGLTWSKSTPSPFYGTITMPTFHRLKDGRLLFFWCNTTPLPEPEGNDGVWEDVFTNRSAVHVAISEDDGKSWIGMRELLLDVGRNDHQFATKAGHDKSVHQVQCVELEQGKLLVSLGQSPNHRKMLVFDTKWIYEDERSCTFENGLHDWTAFQYFKGIKGHCGYNRTECDILRNHSEVDGRKMIAIGYTPNPDLVCDRMGALWNFPAARDGVFTTSLKFPKGSQPIDLILNDRWFNAPDIVAADKSIYHLKLSRKELKINDEKWHKVEIKWQQNRAAKLYVDNKLIKKIELQNPTIHGVSYAHFIGGTTPDKVGVWIESVAAKKQ